MESKYWKEKWAAKDTQFHREIPNARMVTYFSEVSPRRVVVPLCGKSLDMVWLSKHGHEVMGFELSPLACEAFFEENAIAFEKKNMGEGTLYRGEKVSIWCGDIFKSPPALWEKTQSIYDRAALVALPPEMRRQYADLLNSRAPKGTTYLLITYEYESKKELGPPFSVPEAEVREIFGSRFQIKLLNRERDEDLSHRPGKFAETEVTEKVFELS